MYRVICTRGFEMRGVVLPRFWGATQALSRETEKNKTSTRLHDRWCTRTERRSIAHPPHCFILGSTSSVISAAAFDRREKRTDSCLPHAGHYSLVATYRVPWYHTPAYHSCRRPTKRPEKHGVPRRSSLLPRHGITTTTSSSRGFLLVPSPTPQTTKGCPL
jgi:hypothetical protein